MPSRTPGLPLPPFIAALEAWRRQPGPRVAARVARELDRVVRRAGFDGAALRLDAPPLASLEVRAGSLRAPAEPSPARGNADAIALRAVPSREQLGVLQLDRAGEPAGSRAELAEGIGLAVQAVVDRERARRAEANLAALDTAVRGIAGELDLDRVLQGIVDRVRELVNADYAALGMVDERGAIQLFLTSGISDEERERIGALPRGHGLLGLIIREGRSFRIADIAVDPRRHGLPPNHPEMHPFLGVPVRAHAGIVGNLYLTRRLGGPHFTIADQELVERFALHAGIAIGNARLHDRAQRLNIVEERERIGRDLHDTTIQRLYGLNLSLEDVPELLAEEPAEAALRVERAIDTISRTIGEIRTFVFGLQPLDVSESGIVGALEHMAGEISRSLGLEVGLETDLAREPPMSATAELLSVTREALTNIVRHADATSALVALTDAEGTWRLEIADNGRGFDPKTAVRSGHHGIANMRERAHRMGGTLKVASRQGRGTRIILTVAHDPELKGPTTR